MKRKAFSKEEDDLINTYAQNMSWVNMSRLFVNRSDDSLRNRWCRMHNPTKIPPNNDMQKHKKYKERIFFTAEEDAFISEFVQKHGTQWQILAGDFSKHFRSITSQSTRNRWARLSRRQLAIHANVMNANTPVANVNHVNVIVANASVAIVNHVNTIAANVPAANVIYANAIHVNAPAANAHEELQLDVNEWLSFT
jgi:hypothetical protein